MAAFTQAGVKMVVKDMGKFKSDLKTASAALDDLSKNIDKQAAAAGDSSKKTEDMGAVMQKVAPWMMAAGAALGALVIKTTLTAARTEELGIVLEIVAKNMGHSITSVRDFEQAIKDLGIRTQVADTLLIQFMRYNLDTAKSVDLARVAQDAAVISMMDSSDALKGLLHGIITYNTRVLRTYGVTVNLGQAFRNWAKANDTTVEAMTGTEKQTVALNEVLANGEAIAGAYEGAMDSAGKQLRSMRRYLEEAANEFGEHMLPTMLSVVEGARDLLFAFQGLSDPVQGTTIQFMAFQAVMLSVGGAAAFIIPQIAALAAVIGVSTLALAGVGGLIAALGLLVIVLINVQKEQQREAAELAETSKTYSSYIRRVEEAGVADKALTEETWKLVKAKQAEGEAVKAIDYVEAEKNLRDFVFMSIRVRGTTEDMAEAFKKEFIPRLSEAGVEIAANEKSLAAMAMKFGLAQEEAEKFAEIIARESKIVESNTRALERNEDVYDGAVQAIGKATGATEAAGAAIDDTTDAAKEQEKALKALEDTIEDIREKYEDFYGTLAGGIVTYRELGEKATQSAKDYKTALRDLRADASESYDDIRAKYENSLPDATSVQERLGMVGDAWDEWRLRMNALMDGAQGEQEASWLATLHSMTAGTDLAFNEQQETIEGWMGRLKTAFGENELPQLINTDAQAWIDHQNVVKAAQAEETAAVRANQAEKARILKEARDAEIAAEQEARNRAMLELSLSLAEQTGLLQAWSLQRFGPDFSQVADSADEVLGLLDSGILEIDGSLQTLLQQTTAGVQTALETTGSSAEATKAILDDIVTTDWAVEQQKVLDQALNLEGMLPEEDINAMMSSVGIAITEGITEDPFGFMAENFVGAEESIIESAGQTNLALLQGLDDFDVANNTTLAAVVKTWTDSTKEISDLWVGSKTLIPDLIKGIGDLESTWDSALDKMLKRMIGEPDGFVTRTGHEFHIMATALKLEIQAIIDKLNEIPSFIKIIITYVEEDDPTGGSASAPFGSTAAPVLPQPVNTFNMSFNPTINNGMDAAVFQSSVEQAVLTALRG